MSDDLGTTNATRDQLLPLLDSLREMARQEQNDEQAAFFDRIRAFLEPVDIYQGLVKAFVFGVVVTLLGCYKGLYASGGARGVGLATTQAVVLGSVSVFLLDYVLTALML